RPGHRAPHVWLTPDTSILDLLGPGFTLLDFSGGNAGRAWERHAQAMGVPLSVKEIDHMGAKDLYGAELVLVRRHMMVSWRGSLDADVGVILQTASGRMLQSIPA